MRIAICDDEKICLDEIQKEISAYEVQYNRSFHINSFLSANKLLCAVNGLQFDAIFLDISMPEMNGLALAKQIRQSDPDVQIVFVTNMSDEISRGYEVFAAGFIIKPIIHDALFDTLNRIIAQYDRKRIPPYEVKLKGGQKATLTVQNLLYLESAKGKHIIRAVSQDKTGKTVECYLWGSLSAEISHLAQYGFAQIHRSFLVNMSWIWIASNEKIIFTNNISLDIGPKYAESFKETYRKYRKGGLF